MRMTKKQKEGVTQEDLDSKLDVIIEQNTEILKLKPAFEKMDKRLGRVETDVAVIKVGQANLQKDVDILKSDVKVLKTDVAVLKSDVAVLKADMIVVKSDIKDIKHDLNKKADKTELDALKHQMNKFA